jgi:hypothetical protein
LIILFINFSILDKNVEKERIDLCKESNICEFELSKSEELKLIEYNDCLVNNGVEPMRGTLRPTVRPPVKKKSGWYVGFTYTF